MQRYLLLLPLLNKVETKSSITFDLGVNLLGFLFPGTLETVLNVLYLSIIFPIAELLHIIWKWPY